MQREEMESLYRKVYDSLNQAQQEAVDAVYGPVMVIAGPGTGKTQILSARVGKILLELDFLPENILCLTYTDAGRVAMRKRLQGMIGATAYRVQIHTFHSFCNQIIQQHASYFTRGNLEAVSELERMEFIFEIIDSFPPEHPLRRDQGDRYYEARRLADLYAHMKMEGWSPAFVKQAVEAYLLDLPLRDIYIAKRKSTSKGVTYQKGDIRTDKIEDDKRKMDPLLAAIDTYTLYEAIMRREHRYDFEDMINWVNKALAQEPGLLADYQEQFQFILVDEFQDTSGAQNRLLQLLCQDVEQPNIFVVGDDDQSIYRFQGANLGNMLDFIRTYSNQLTSVVLQENYRSTQAILNWSRYVISNNQDRLVRSNPAYEKHLQAALPERIQSPVRPVLQEYENTLQECMGLTLQIESLLSSGMKPADIAVIYSEHKYGEMLMAYLHERRIPVYHRKKEDVLQLPVILKVRQVLRYIECETTYPGSGDDLLFEILHYDWFNIPAIQVARVSIRVHEQGYDKRTYLRTYLQNWVRKGLQDLFDEGPDESLKQAVTLLEKWIKDSLNLPLVHLVENILMDGGAFTKAWEDEPNRIWNLDMLRVFLDFIREEMHRHPDQNLAALNGVMNLMVERGIPLPLYRSFGSEAGVNLLTAHSSKGLEFRQVFLANANASRWEKKQRNSRAYRFPDTLFSTLRDASDDVILEEQRRLFFVAMTRAEEYLTISWSRKDDQEKVMEPSRFIAEIQDQEKVVPQIMQVKAEEVASFLAVHLFRNKRPVLPAPEKELITALVNRFEMNSTALNNFLQCPLKFYYQNLIRVPTGISEASTFGSAVHYALERLFVRMKNNQQLFPEAEVMLQDFERELYRNREHFTREAYTRKLEYGRRILQSLYDKNVNTWEKNVSIEWFVKQVVVDGIPLKGKIDKMEFRPDGIYIVDYKTGKYENAKKKLSPPSAALPAGGDYWRQGVFYKILVEGHKLKNYQVHGSQFQFVEPDKEGHYYVQEIIPTQDDIQLLREQISQTWARIQAHDFYTGCGEADCEWCHFVKQHALYSSLEDKPEEDEEDIDAFSSGEWDTD